MENVKECDRKRFIFGTIVIEDGIIITMDIPKENNEQIKNDLVKLFFFDSQQIIEEVDEEIK
jgi:hypothetical protein